MEKAVTDDELVLVVPTRLFHEAGLFQGAGIPAVICGPGSIAQAHRADEFVSLEQLDLCAAFLRRLAHKACE